MEFGNTGKRERDSERERECLILKAEIELFLLALPCAGSTSASVNFRYPIAT